MYLFSMICSLLNSLATMRLSCYSMLEWLESYQALIALSDEIKTLPNLSAWGDVVA